MSRDFFFYDASVAIVTAQVLSMSIRRFPPRFTMRKILYLFQDHEEKMWADDSVVWWISIEFVSIVKCIPETCPELFRAHFFLKKKKNDEQSTARQHDVRISYPVRVNK